MSGHLTRWVPITFGMLLVLPSAQADLAGELSARVPHHYHASLKQKTSVGIREEWLQQQVLAVVSCGVAKVPGLLATVFDSIPILSVVSTAAAEKVDPQYDGRSTKGEFVVIYGGAGALYGAAMAKLANKLLGFRESFNLNFKDLKARVYSSSEVIDEAVFRSWIQTYPRCGDALGKLRAVVAELASRS
jgi:hypothetical protein